ncbi:MAG: hypothetical protein IKF51_03580 [Solobacterium sp.]|nr:hypothetical protein [Solobacterium sp.]
MFKKFQDLFFEDEDDIEEEEEVVEVQPRRRKEAPAPEEKPAMKRIDVTTEMPKAETAAPVPPAAPARREPAPVFEEPVRETKPVQEKKATSLNIDDLAEGRSAAYQAPAKPGRKAPAKAANNKKPSYEFQPVISPYFGVAEKDVDSMATSAAPSTKKGKDEYTPQIISPMYGIKTEDRPSSIQTTVEKSNRMEEMTPAPKKVEAEERVPDFSLDDILNRRDEEELVQTSLFDDSDEIDTTTVFRTDREGE